MSQADVKASYPPLPPLDPELIKALELRFPERSPDKHESSEDLRWRGGQCSVIRFLRDEFKRQSENILKAR